MARKRHTTEQIINHLREAEVELSRGKNISTVWRWQKLQRGGQFLTNIEGGTHIGGRSYAQLRKIRPEPHPDSFEAIIRRELESHSSDSEAFSGKHDLFYSVDGIGGGTWGLRSALESTPKAEDIGSIEDGTSRVHQETYRILRDTKLALKIKLLHMHQCQLCGMQISLDGDERVYSEAHHIQPLGKPHNGPDTADNILVLCPNHHVMLDYGAIPLKDKDIQLVKGHSINQKFIVYHNNIIWFKNRQPIIAPEQFTRSIKIPVNSNVNWPHWRQIIMTDIIGVDGCKGGWLAIHKDLRSGDITSEVCSSGDQLIGRSTDPEVLAIDIPIGLTNSGPRQCDLVARKMLGRPRGTSVFPAPIRPALTASDRREADSISRSVHGKGVGAQAFGLYPRIREIDETIRNNQKTCGFIYEIHPELCFMAWNHGKPVQESKKSHDGMSIRLALIKSHFGADAVSTIRQNHPRSQVADDDIYDAFAALWTAGRINLGVAEVIPDIQETDSTGLDMRMWYWRVGSEWYMGPYSAAASKKSYYCYTYIRTFGSFIR
jgi:predicted RNase H-like nuclease